MKEVWAMRGRYGAFAVPQPKPVVKKKAPSMEKIMQDSFRDNRKLLFLLADR